MSETVSGALVLADVGPDAWSAFQSGSMPAIARDLRACWERSRSLGAPILGARPEEQLLRGDALRLHAGHVELVQAIGDAVLDRATARVADRDFLLLLADADGVVVTTRGGGDFESTARDLRLIEGASWSERDRGTNAIGTAAAANQAIEVHGHAHFGQSYRDLVCYAAPIRGIDGRPIAVLDATSRLASADASVGRVIVRAAAALEELLRLQAYAAAGVSITRILGHSIERMRDPALLVEVPGRVVRANAAANALLGRAIAGVSVDEALCIDWPSLVAESLSPAVGGRPVEIGRGTQRRAWRMRVEPITAPHGGVVAVMVVFEPGRTTLVLPASNDGAREPHDAHDARNLLDGNPLDAHRAVYRDGDAFDAIFTEDASVMSSIAWARKLATSDLPVMLLAETGAGKELFARAIHAASSRATAPILAINCGAVAPSLLEAELFGYAGGAFTGADRAGRHGLFHAARGGTLFLDEVAEMSPAMQASLLRVLETGTYRRVGDTRLERTDVRVVCATCRDLGAMVTAGTFRQDLYYRLKGATVRIPALRERTDILSLARHLLGGALDLAPAAATALAAHAWPGNVRELKSMLAVARLHADGGSIIELAHLPAEIAAPATTSSGALEDGERDTLRRVLAEADGNLSDAARRLGVARSTLYRMLRRHGLG